MDDSDGHHLPVKVYILLSYFKMGLSMFLVFIQLLGLSLLLVYQVHRTQSLVSAVTVSTIICKCKTTISGKMKVIWHKVQK